MEKIRTTRISTDIEGFNADINVTNDYLGKACPPPVGNTNGKRLGWSEEEIAKWLSFQTEWTPVYLLYSNKKGKRTTDVTAQLYQIIDKCRTYEHDNHLYDRIAVCTDAVNLDFETFRVVRNTPLEETVHTPAPPVGNKTVMIAIKETGHLYHKLLVKSPNVDGRAKEAGVKDILIFVAYTDIAGLAPTLDKYQYYGDVKRGYIIVQHAEAQVGRKAWFIGRVKNSRGEIGLPSNPESGGVI